MLLRSGNVLVVLYYRPSHDVLDQYIYIRSRKLVFFRMIPSRAIDRASLHRQNHLHGLDDTVTQGPHTRTNGVLQFRHRLETRRRRVVKRHIEDVGRVRRNVSKNVGTGGLHLEHSRSKEKASPEAPLSSRRKRNHGLVRNIPSGQEPFGTYGTVQ